MKKTFIYLFFFIPTLTFAQINYTNEAKKDLKEQDSILKISYADFKKAKDSLKVLSEILSPKISEYYKEAILLKKQTDSLYDVAKTSLSFYSQKNVNQKILDSVISLPDDYSVGFKEKQEEKQEETTYLYFGDKKVISKNEIIKDPIANEVLTNVFSEESEMHFGNFWFPQDGQSIPLFTKSCRDSIKKGKNCIDIKYLKFEKITIDLYEGTLRDIKVYLKGINGKIYLFENSVGISLLRLNKLSGRNYLGNSSIQTDKNGASEYKNHSVKVSDVFRYFSQPNGNYVPHDESFTFPIETKEGKTNKKSSNIYELRQSTSLNNVIDLRAYTDILGLANQSANGITNFSGQADFFIIPFRLDTHFIGNVFLLKKIKPYISYSRFDDNDKFLTLTDGSSSDFKTLETRIEHLRKSYLDTGVKLFLLNFKLLKELPFETGLYGSLRYQLSRINLTSGVESYKTLGMGGGINFEFKRFKNFSLNYSFELSDYNQNSYNKIKGFEDHNNFLVMRNEAEFSYYPVEKKNNAIFLKLITFDDMTKGADANFFQLQFGYKFVIGAGKIKTK
ncbi:hypothetical protein [Tenacibaculum ovolyticum]|uniref:hypothetical protein n=1 Tax=Tenacibaculum ovolyticum TaxID=104270 RepID=UPI000419A795|nr:hypothetical protein [Tenacibaculum ovolyticum]